MSKTAQLIYARVQALLQFLITPRHPSQVGSHRGGQVSFLPSSLTAAQRSPVNLSRSQLHNQQSSAKAVPPRYCFARRQQEGAWRPRGAQARLPFHPASTL